VVASRTSLVIADLLTALRANHTTVDLRTTSSTPRVLCPAMAMLPPSAAPLLVISAPSVRPSYDGAIGKYRNVAEHEWTLWIASTADDPATRAGIALVAAHDVIGAIETAHASSSYTTLHGLVELLVTLEDVIGEDIDDAPGFAIATGRISWVDYPTGVGI
jgi:hypothetical protein